jgi:hypothetical protein
MNGKRLRIAAAILLLGVICTLGPAQARHYTKAQITAMTQATSESDPARLCNLHLLRIIENRNWGSFLLSYSRHAKSAPSKCGAGRRRNLTFAGAKRAVRGR